MGEPAGEEGRFEEHAKMEVDEEVDSMKKVDQRKKVDQKYYWEIDGRPDMPKSVGDVLKEKWQQELLVILCCQAALLKMSDLQRIPVPKRCLVFRHHREISSSRSMCCEPH